jgi:SAM-dependent methyltransferase
MRHMARELARNALGYGGRVPVLRGMLVTLHRVRYRNHPWMRQHPFDRSYGISTNGFLPRWLLRSGTAADAHTTVYAGCQPSCLRQALSVVPRLESRAFVDLGCGKGRALVVASEFPFRRILGVELTPALAPIVRRNAAIVRRRYPKRTAIDVVEGDATEVQLPEGDLVIFLYNSFGQELVARLAARIEEAVEAGGREVFFVYENPACREVIDARPGFALWFCKRVPCDASEVGFAAGDSDAVAVWRIGSLTSASA